MRGFTPIELIIAGAFILILGTVTVSTWYQYSNPIEDTTVEQLLQIEGKIEELQEQVDTLLALGAPQEFIVRVATTTDPLNFGFAIGTSTTATVFGTTTLMTYGSTTLQQWDAGIAFRILGPATTTIFSVDTDGNLIIAGACTGCGEFSSNWTYISDSNGDFIIPSTTVGTITSASSTFTDILNVEGHLSASSTLSVADILTVDEIHMFSSTAALAEIDLTETNRPWRFHYDQANARFRFEGTSGDYFEINLDGTNVVLFGSSITDFVVNGLGAFRSASDSADDLGSSSRFWDETFTDELILTNDGTAATAANKIRLGGQDIDGGDAALLITSEDDTDILLGTRSGFASTTPWGQLSIEMVQGIVSPEVPAFVIGDQGSSTIPFIIDANGFLSVGNDISILGTGTSTIVSGLSLATLSVTDYVDALVLNATSTSASSTIAWGLIANALDIQSTSASSTFAHGIEIATGCFSIAGTCVGGAGGGGAWTSAAGLTTMDTATDQLLVGTSTAVTGGGMIASTSITAFQGLQDQSSGTLTMDLDNQNSTSWTLSAGNVTINFSNGTPGQHFSVETCQDSTGGRDITTWDADIHWENNATSSQNADADTCTSHFFMVTHATTSQIYIFTGSTQTP